MGGHKPCGSPSLGLVLVAIKVGQSGASWVQTGMAGPKSGLPGVPRLGSEELRSVRLPNFAVLDRLCVYCGWGSKNMDTNVP